MTTKYRNLICVQEQPVWWNSKPLKPDESITADQGGFTTVIPDLGIVMVVEDKRDIWLLIGELKRSPRRAYMKLSMERSSQGWVDLFEKLGAAISQVQRQAFVYFHKTDKTEVVLFAASGPFWTWVSVSRKEIEAVVRKPATVDIETFLENLAERLELNHNQVDEDDPVDVDEDQLLRGQSENVQDIPPQFKMTRDDLFGWDKRAEKLRRIHEKSDAEKSSLSKLEEKARARVQSNLQWADVMVTGSKKSNEEINKVRSMINKLMGVRADS